MFGTETICFIFFQDGQLAKFKVPIKETQEAEIFDPIEVRPEYVAFAYQPGQPGYQFPLKVRQKERPLVSQNSTKFWLSCLKIFSISFCMSCYSLL